MWIRKSPGYTVILQIQKYCEEPTVFRNADKPHNINIIIKAENDKI